MLQTERVVSEKLFKMSLLGPIKRNHFLFQALLEITNAITWANQTQSFSFSKPFWRSLSYACLHYHLYFIQKYYVICTNHHFFGFCFCILSFAKLLFVHVCVYTSPKSEYGVRVDSNFNSNCSLLTTTIKWFVHYFG
jgi:hypothetical protein